MQGECAYRLRHRRGSYMKFAYLSYVTLFFITELFHFDFERHIILVCWGTLKWFDPVFDYIVRTSLSKILNDILV